MARMIVGVIVGYLAMFILVSVAFTVAFVVLGTNYVFKPGSFAASNLWIATAMVINLIVAIIAGVIAVAIAGRGKAAKVLAIVVFGLGLLLSIPTLMVPRTGAVRTTNDVPMFEAMQKAEEPRWVPFALPIVGVMGVLIGGRLKKAD
jgi:hypothetical protein